MGSNSAILDLTGTVWTPQDFENHDLKVIPGKTPKIAFSPHGQEIRSSETSSMSNWGAGVVQGVKHWSLGRDDPCSIFAVSEGIDTLAHELLNLEFEELKAPHSAEEILTVIQITLQHVTNLKKNLESHDRVVKDYNNRFFINVLGCPTHEKALKEIDEKLEQLSKMQKLAQVQVDNEKNKND